MIRASQVDRIKRAWRDYHEASRMGSRKDQARCNAVLNAVYRNSSEGEIWTAINC